MKLEIGTMLGDDYLDLLLWLDVENIDYKAYYTSGSGWFTILEVEDDIATVIKLKFMGAI
jgi:hypothetical protein